MFDIPLTETTLDEEEVEAATRVLRSKWLTMGAEVAAFEEEFAVALGCRHAVAAANGTAALEIAISAAGIGLGDEVILPAITFIACLNAVRRAGARGVLADVTSEDDLTIDVEDVRSKIGPRTRAIMPMAYGGYCPDMENLVAIAEDRGVALIEDACHAPLAELGGRKIGTFGLAGTWSFFGNKNMTTGEGGMITSNDADFVGKCRLMRSHGITKTTWDRAQGHASEYDVALVGTNARLDEIRAAIGRVQLRKLPTAIRARTEAASVLRRALETAAIPSLGLPFSHSRGTPVHHLFAVLLPRRCNRDAVMTSMREAGIQTSIHYPPLHQFSGTKSYFASDGCAEGLVVSEAIAGRILTLPLGPTLTPGQIDRIAEALGQACAKT